MQVLVVHSASEDVLLSEGETSSYSGRGVSGSQENQGHRRGLDISPVRSPHGHFFLESGNQVSYWAII